MRFACPGCGAVYDIKQPGRLTAAGGRVECYRCHEVFTVAVPLEDAETPPVALAPAPPPQQETPAGAPPAVDRPAPAETVTATEAPPRQPEPQATETEEREAPPASGTPAEESEPGSAAEPASPGQADAGEPATPRDTQGLEKADNPPAPDTPVEEPKSGPAAEPASPGPAPAGDPAAPEEAQSLDKTDRPPAPGGGVEQAAPGTAQRPAAAPAAPVHSPPTKSGLPPPAAAPAAGRTGSEDEAAPGPGSAGPSSPGPKESASAAHAAATAPVKKAEPTGKAPAAASARPAGPRLSKAAGAPTRKEHPATGTQRTSPEQPPPATRQATPAVSAGAAPAAGEKPPADPSSGPSLRQKPPRAAVEDVITGARHEYELKQSPEQELAVQSSFPNRSSSLNDHFEPPRRGQIPLPAWAEKAVWGAAALLLLVFLVAQTLWHFRADPGVNVMLSAMCEDLGCDVPLLRQPGALKVTDRIFTRDPDYPDILVLRLRVANGAGFPQPYPGVELVLYDKAQAVVGKSRVTSAQYRKGTGDRTLRPGDRGEIELLILDPGQAATGFAVEFF